MQPDIDAQLSNFFEETPPRDFARIMSGYDPHQVNEALKQLDNELRHTATVPRPCSGSCRGAPPAPGARTPDLLGLGSRIEQLLRLAEEQATEILQEARAAANELMQRQGRGRRGPGSGRERSCRAAGQC